MRVYEFNNGVKFELPSRIFEMYERCVGICSGLRLEGAVRITETHLQESGNSMARQAKAKDLPEYGGVDIPRPSLSSSECQNSQCVKY
jgi:hypothetical protein